MYADENGRKQASSSTGKRAEAPQLWQRGQLPDSSSARSRAVSAWLIGRRKTCEPHVVLLALSGRAGAGAQRQRSGQTSLCSRTRRETWRVYRCSDMQMLYNYAMTCCLCVCAVDRKKSGRRGTVAEERPDLVAQWDSEANGAHTPYKVTAGSPYKAAWRYESLFALHVAQSLAPALRSATPAGIQLHLLEFPFRLQTFSELASRITC